MIEIISIHIPKTAGTSFYHLLQQEYGRSLSISYRRKDVVAVLTDGEIPTTTLPIGCRVLHGHFYYSEVQPIHQQQRAKLICWLRDPVERVISNYHFFRAGLIDPDRNPAVYDQNKHRIQETLLTFAARPENRNRIATFLAGMPIDDFYFVGRVEHFAADVKKLGQLLDWQTHPLPLLLNQKDQRLAPASVREQEKQAIAELNALDLQIHQQLLARYHPNAS